MVYTDPHSGSDTQDILSALQYVIERSLTTAGTSTLYNGGGAANILQESIATSALPGSADVIEVGEHNTLDVMVVAGTAAQTITLTVAEFSTSTPTIATLIRQICVATGSDQTRTVDSACVGVATGTEYYAKQPVSVDVTPGSYVQISVVENITGSARARYVLRTR